MLDQPTQRSITSWLPANARQVGALGWTPTESTRTDREWRVVDQPADRPALGENLDAVVWREQPHAPLTRAALTWVRERLTPRGTLILARPIPLGDDPTSSPASGSGLRRTIQNLVVLLSELGFAIRYERTLSVADGTLAVIVARRDPFRVRPFRRDDALPVDALFTQNFFVERGPEAWRWKFDDNPYGPRQASVATNADGDVVGHYAGVSFRFVDARSAPIRAYSAIQMCDIMTAASVRRSGLGRTAMISRLWRHFYARYAENTVGFVVGFNTASSRGMALRFHEATELEPIASWQREVDTVTTGPRGYRVEALTGFDSGFDRLFARVAPAYGALVERNQRYLEWRYAQRPDARYQIYGAYRWRRLVGWGVFRRDGDTLVWGDALCDPDHANAAEAIVATAVAAEPSRPRELRAWFAHRPAWWRAHLLHHGWQATPERHGLSLIYGMHKAPEAEDALRTLYYTMGDSDLF